jgi:hypothetical protein
MHSGKGREVGRLKFLRLPPSKGKRPTLFLHGQPVERCWDATHEERGAGCKWRSEVVELLGHNPGSRRADLKVEPGFAQLRIAQS